MSRNKRPFQYIDLPYNFISLPEKYYYPYTKKRDANENEVLPKHSKRKEISGYIEYKLIPKTDLAVEVRKIEEENKFFLSGSVMRGRVRTNLEILSKSYPQFVNYTPMLFRCIAGDLKDLRRSYREQLGVEEGIEKSIRVGFLKKDNNNKFFVVSAKKFSYKKFFLSIKEHEFMNKFSINLEEENRLFKSKDEKRPNKINDIFSEINKIQNEVNMKTEKIKKIREENEEKISSFDSNMSDIFIKKFTFNKKLGDLKEEIKNNIKSGNINKLDDLSNKYWSELQKIKNNLYYELKKLEKKENDLDEFFELMSQRWMLKAKIELLYHYLTKVSKNSEYKPYQMLVFYKTNDNGGIEDIFNYPSKKEEGLFKGYLYNSNNAESKRSHYLINEPEEEKGMIFEVPEDVIESYKQNYKKINFTKGEKSLNKEMASFYDIFNNENYEKLIEENREGPIVFFQLEDNEDKTAQRVKRIGRTPYFKIPYKYSLKDIIGEKEKNEVDYAEALFGYVTEKEKAPGQNREEKDIYLAYKSRLRFSAIDIEWNELEQKKQFDLEKLLKPNRFLLSSPSPTAYGMYLKQVDDAELITYQDKEAKLRGYKYYHIWDSIEESKQGNENNISIRGVIAKESILQLKGRIYFYNLKPQELGLLLISLNIKEFLKSNKYYNDFEELFNYIKNSHELIGGANPYGYGNVNVEIEDIYIEKEDNFFEALIIGPIKEEKRNWSEYIDKYLEEAYKAGKKCVLCRIKEYVDSKQERVRHNTGDGDFTRQRPKRISWYSLNKNIGKKIGYPNEWRLIDKTYKNQ